MLKYLSIVCFFTAAILTGDCFNVTCEFNGMPHEIGEVFQIPCYRCECTLNGTSCKNTCNSENEGI
uniref:VWFC domain-containing protein n=1 Tax=Octopus bimaculoides TaxID=37653 RepID=A0A0L8I5R8_OCTBM